MEIRKIALAGNPNTGKTSLFNLLTGLNQRVGNFPGVTVDKKTGSCTLPGGRNIEVMDLPGTYSVFPRSEEEKIVFDVLSNKNHADHPDLLVFVADVTNLERNLLLYTQLHDLKIPMLLVLTMSDIAEERKASIDTEQLAFHLGQIPTVKVNGRTGEGIELLKAKIEGFRDEQRHFRFSQKDPISILSESEAQVKDAEWRFIRIRELLGKVSVKQTDRPAPKPNENRKLDRILLHPVWGYVIFAAVLFLIFQSIFSIAEYPMNWIDGTFMEASQWLKEHISPGVFTDLLAEGIVPGIGGVVVFIPQIALLFFFLSILEESGYMSRVVFMMDKLVRPFGLNGKSVVPLVGSVACAIPGIMATRTISSWKDRMVTIMVAPLMSCSARIPVFTLLIALTIPDEKFGPFNLKGLVLLGLYLLGLFGALFMAVIFKYLIRPGEKGYLLMEMPTYQWPRWKAILILVKEKVQVFVFDAGKVILAISILLWVLCSYGPSQRMDLALSMVELPNAQNGKTEKIYEAEMEAVRLENSYIGIVGKAIEPSIKPLGYDWKIGISLLTSFAAREVFVGSMAAIYSVGEDFEEDSSLLDRMRNEKHVDTGLPVYTLASGVSLMVFYVFAMQCMSTLAVVKRETRSWKWPLIQLFYMGILAYVAAWISFVILS
jgi:ferrous iron transport protein B